MLGVSVIDDVGVRLSWSVHAGSICAVRACAPRACAVKHSWILVALECKRSCLRRDLASSAEVLCFAMRREGGREGADLHEWVEQQPFLQA